MTEIDRLSNRATVDRARLGDMNAFRELVRTYKVQALAIARQRVRDPEDALDIVQEAFLRMHRALPRFRGDASIETWLHRIIVNLAIDHNRKSQRRIPTVELSENLIDTRETAATEAPETDTAARDRVHAAMDQLSHDHREILLRRTVEGTSYADLAKTFQIPLGTVMSRLHTARARLRRSLEMNAGGAGPNSCRA